MRHTSMDPENRGADEREEKATQQVQVASKVESAPASEAAPAPRPRRTTKPRAPSTKMKAAATPSTRVKAAAPASTRVKAAPPPSTRVKAAPPPSTRVKAAAKGESIAPPPSRRAPAKKTAAASPPKSVRVPRASRVSGRDDASIPPIASDLDEQGNPVAATDRAAVVPGAPLAPYIPVEPTLASNEDAAPVLALGRPKGSPYWKAAAGLAAAACLVFGLRGVFLHRAPHAPPAAAVATEAPVAPVLPPVPAIEEAPAPPAETPAPESAEDAKHASLAALEQGKLDESIEIGERATALDPTDADSWLILGAAYRTTGTSSPHAGATASARSKQRRAKSGSARSSAVSGSRSARAGSPREGTAGACPPV